MSPLVPTFPSAPIPGAHASSPALPGRRTPTNSAPQTPEALHKVAAEFEAQVLSFLIQPLLKDIGASEGASSQLTQQLLSDSIADMIRERGGFGITDIVAQALERISDATGTTPEVQP